MRWACALLLLGTLWPNDALAQQSSSFILSDRVLNGGGVPSQGIILSSGSFLLTLGAIGDHVAAQGVASDSFRLDSGFVSWFPPPLEVHDLVFAGGLLTWTPEPAAESYNLYRDLVSSLPTLGYGACDMQGIASSQADVGPAPAGGQTYFYLVTARNHLNEDGTKGFRSSGQERMGSLCP